MATSVPTGPIDNGSTPSYVGAAMQSGAAPAPDTDEYSVPGAYAEGQAVAGAEHMPNAAQPGSTAVAGQPAGEAGGAGSTGIVGLVIKG